MGVKKVLDELLVQYLFYGYSVHISILSFQHENCKRMHPSGFQIITWQAVVLSLCLRGSWEDERGDAPAILLADNLSDRLYETGAGEEGRWQMVLPRNIRNMSAMKKMTPMDHCRPNKCRSPYHPYGRQGEEECHDVG